MNGKKEKKRKEKSSIYIGMEANKVDEKKSETRHQNNKTDGASSIVLASSTA